VVHIVVVVDLGVPIFGVGGKLDVSSVSKLVTGSHGLARRRPTQTDTAEGSARWTVTTRGSGTCRGRSCRRRTGRGRSWRCHGHTDTSTKASATTAKHMHERVSGSQLASCRNYIEHPPSIERGRCHRRKGRAPAVGLDEEQRGRECGKCSSPRRPEVVRLGRRPATTLRTGGGDE
jgi:hypothetical protein